MKWDIINAMSDISIVLCNPVHPYGFRVLLVVPKVRWSEDEIEFVISKVLLSEGSLV